MKKLSKRSFLLSFKFVFMEYVLLPVVLLLFSHTVNLSLCLRGLVAVRDWIVFSDIYVQ